MDEATTVGRVLADASGRLDAGGNRQSRLDAEVLLAHVLGVPRHEFYARPDQSLAPEHESQFQELIRRRLEGEPVAYLIGEREFFSLTFEVNRAVLVPRPETEHVVEAALEHLVRIEEQRGDSGGGGGATFFDVGTGSGAIAVAILANRPNVRGTACDISGPAVEVARRNAERHGVADRLEFLVGDLFGDFEGTVDLIVANLPYVSENERGALLRDVRDFEPAVALFDGGDGLNIIRRLIDTAPKHLRSGGKLIFEIGSAQEDRIGDLLSSAGQWRGVEIRKDLAGIPRVMIATKV